MENIVNRTEQIARMRSDKGFIAALDQSGGSTPKALQLYGISEDQFTDEEEMFNLMHDMRTRIITSSCFSEAHIIGAILFEQTMERHVSGIPTAEFLWNTKKIVPFLKIDKGLKDPKDGVRLMKDIPNLHETLKKALDYGIFGTKMRSVIDEDNVVGIEKIVDQQFEIGKITLDAGLTPIIEPEVTINISQKLKAEKNLKQSLIKNLNKLAPKQKILLKLTLPEKENFYQDLVKHPNVLRVVALSGGYSLEEANKRLRENYGVVASFSRALTQSLFVHQNIDEFNSALEQTISAIADASKT
ncbi:MAG: fructose bisphosphate aldolase [Rhodobacteraceae bacterium]|jgi:fructose-bisphosphate aldolase class I|nr:MAG: fructose bisphosphate aldolase [Paracoccaceae bacterium]|tara:strand:+ start:6527 stop:7429 length:903 start_codon:yes stop_codon:yes gene_type:complete